MTYYYTTELYHHGIKGQRWGIRRYQNYDGSYTQAGLKRYNTAVDEYEKIRDSQSSSMSERKDAKRNVKRAYRQLKNDFRADEGKKLYDKGQRISKNLAIGVGANVGGYFAKRAIANRFGQSIGKDTVNGFANGDTDYVKIGGKGIGMLASQSAVDAITDGITYSRGRSSRRLKEYYKHEKMYDSGKDFVKKVLSGKL